MPVSFPPRPLAAALLLTLSGGTSAGLHFDPAMLSGESGAVADLSRFESGGSQLPGRYDVDITLNGSGVGHRSVQFVVPDLADRRGADGQALTADDTGLLACLSVKDLASFGVNPAALPALSAMDSTTCVSPGRYIPQARTAFDFENMRLDLSIPQFAMMNRPQGWIPPELWDEGINAAFLSGQLSGSENRGTYGNSRSQFLNLTSGLNLGAWRLRDNSTWTNNASSVSHQQRWQHLSTVLERAIIPWHSELTLGDSSTDNDVFDALAYRGVRLATDDSMYPDTLRGFAPTIRGTADSNAQVSVRQGNNVIYRTFVAPGAFTINDLYPVSTGGDLEVNVIEADGRVHGFTVPYSSVPVLQREGHLRYGLTAGRYRSSSDSYDDPAFVQGTLLWGMPHNVTLYVGTQLSGDYRSMALGAGMNMGRGGALSADVTRADSMLADGSRHHGQSVRFLYGRSLVSTGTTLQLAGYRFSTEGFHTLEESALNRMSGWTDAPLTVDAAGRPVKQNWINHYNLYSNKRDRLQASISQRLGDPGSLYLTCSRQTFWDGTAPNTTLQAGFSSAVGRVNYSLSYGYSRYSGQMLADHSLYLSLSMPLSGWFGDSIGDSRSAWATYSMNRDSDGNVKYQTGLSGTALDRDNLSWSVSQGYGRQDGSSGDASLNYQGTYGNASAGYGYSQRFRQVRYGAAGSAVLHSGGMTFGQPLGATNVLVVVPGATDVPVENGIGVSTDWRGYAVVPYASMYRENRVALDVSRLDRDTDVDNAVSRVIPTRGALVRADFQARTGIRGLLTLTYRGKPLPFGSLVNSDGDGGSSGLTDDQGQVYLAGLRPQGTLAAQWGNGEDQRCVVHYTMPADAGRLPVVRAAAACR